MNYKQLKIFAACCMLFDHAVRIFPLYQMAAPLADWLWSNGHTAAAAWVLADLTFYLMFTGRLAAPIFLFCIAQGLLHTRDVNRYLRRILITAAAAQVPYALFDLAQSRVYGAAGQWLWREVPLNICFTLALGLAARPSWQRALWFLPAVILSRWGLVQWMLTDFTAGPIRNCLLNVAGNYLGMLCTLTCTGEKGDAGKGFQRFMYGFYPLHLALLALAGFLRTPL